MSALDAGGVQFLFVLLERKVCLKVKVGPNEITWQMKGADGR